MLRFRGGVVTPENYVVQAPPQQKIAYVEKKYGTILNVDLGE